MSEVAQSCPTLCDPVDGNLPGSSVHGIFQTRVLEWGAISFSGDLPDSGIEPGCPALQADTSPSEPPGKPSSDGSNDDGSLHLPTAHCVPGLGCFIYSSQNP